MIDAFLVGIGFAVALIAEIRHFIERRQWTTERSLLLDRIQAPSFGEFKQATAAPRPRVAQIMSDEDAYDEEQRRKGAA